MSLLRTLFPGASKPHIAKGPLAELYASQFPSSSTPIDQVPMLAVDMETTGLDPRKDQILSIGWVPINAQHIDLAQARHVLIKQDLSTGVGQSATIHQITDDMLNEGVSEEEALGQLLEALQSRAMVVHFAALETTFSDAACKRYFGAGFDTKKIPVVDTFALERRHMERMGTYPRGEDLRLTRVRERYNLPFYPSHNALVDALACAELFLALRAHSSAQTLKSFL